MSMNIEVGKAIGANYMKGTQAIGGKLIFDEDIMVFSSHTHIEKPLKKAIRYDHITDITKISLSGIPTGIVVETKDGDTHTIAVFNRNGVMDFINSKRQGTTMVPVIESVPQTPEAPKPMKLRAYEGPEPYLFISYAHADSATVLPVLAHLQKEGFRLWFDQGIEVGTEWPEYIAQHLERAHSVLAFMSKSAIASKNCRREINFSIEIDKDPIVIYLEEVELTLGMKLQLNVLQAIFKYHANAEEDFLEELCKANTIQACRKQR